MFPEHVFPEHVAKTSSIESGRPMTLFDRACMSDCTCCGGNRSCRGVYGCFVDRFGHSLRCLQLHQEPLRPRMLQVRAQRSFPRSMSSRPRRWRRHREGRPSLELQVPRPVLPRPVLLPPRLPRPLKRPPRNPYLARSTKIKFRPTSKRRVLPISRTQ